MCTRKHARRGVFTLSCRLPLMIVLITRSGKSHFHEATSSPPPRCHSLSIPGLLFFSSLLSCCLPLLLSFILPPLICMSPSLFILQLSLLPSPSTYPLWSAHLSLLHVSCPKRIFPPTRPRLIPPSLSIYLYQWAKVILSSSSRWADAACGRGREKRGAEEHGFSYFIISTAASGGNTLYKLSFVRGDHLTCFSWLLKGLFQPQKHIKILKESKHLQKKKD